jgi:predicted ArsR family transcriptional regulator
MAVTNLLAAAAATPEEVRSIIERMCETQIAKTAGSLVGKPLAEKVEVLLKAFEHDGFLPAMRQLPDKRWQLSLFNCPLLEIAEKYPAFCDAEANCVGQAAFAEVERVGFRLGGQRACTYLIGPEKLDPQPAADRSPQVSEPVAV